MLSYILREHAYTNVLMPIYNSILSVKPLVTITVSRGLTGQIFTIRPPVEGRLAYSQPTKLEIISLPGANVGAVSQRQEEGSHWIPPNVAMATPLLGSSTPATPKGHQSPWLSRCSALRASHPRSLGKAHKKASPRALGHFDALCPLPLGI